jgi:large subunit ribosomal protein L2
MITSSKPVKSLVSIKKSKAGRNSYGRITTRHRGAGVKKFYRHVDFALTPGLSAVVEAIEYDPNRSARIARIKDDNGSLYYILAGNGMKVGQTVTSGHRATIESGNRLELELIPEGSNIYNIELSPGRGGQLVRSAGVSAQLMAKDAGYAQIRLPSGEVRSVNLKCQATIGAVGNEQHQNVKIGKAGRRRQQGWRPTVRGKAMNAADHPHGGGDGGAHGVGREPKTPWGHKTRSRKQTDKYIIKGRREAKRR